jgi:hypothetical protein
MWPPTAGATVTDMGVAGSPISSSGSVVLTWLYNRSGASILVVSVWHGTFNVFGGTTTATEGTIAAVVSTAKMIKAFVLVALELRARHNGLPSFLGPKTDRITPSRQPQTPARTHA